MSKRKLAAHGWISFTGLRFAQEFATREEIIRIVRNFFSRRGLAFGDLKVEFRMNTRQGRESWNDDQPSTVWGSHHPGVVIVYLRGRWPFHDVTSQTKRSFIETLCHELDHEAWEQEGRGFDYSLPYRQRPHEIRAFSVEEEEPRRFEGLQQVPPQVW